MDLLLIIVAIFVLYWRTNDYYYLIDDIVRRWGFLLEIPEVSPNPNFFAIKPSKFKHLFLTCTHAINCSLIYFLWGWKASLIYAVFPLCVSCTAWITGGYYQITTFFTLTTFYFLFNFTGLTGVMLAAVFFTAALGSTINCIAIPFIFIVHKPLIGLALFWPLAFYLFGRRFQIGFRKRDIGKSDPITWRKSAVVPKVLAYYIKKVVFPLKLSFFQEYGFEYGKNPKVQKDLEAFDKTFWVSLLIIAAFTTFGFLTSPLGLMIFMAGLLPFTQWKVLGQFVAERYLYLPLVGWAMMLSVFPAWIIIPLAIAYAYRSHKYIPAFKNIETLYENGIKNHPKCISNYVNLAERKLHTNKLFDAYKLLKQGLDMDPNSFLCHANLAAYWLAINNAEKGKYHTEMAMATSESRGMAYMVFKQQLEHICQGVKAREAMKVQVDKMLEEIRKEEAVEVEKVLHAV